MADALAEAEARLYGLPLEDFTKARDALARALRKDGDREVAAAVAKLPKPSPVGWTVNRLARDEPGLVEALVSAGERLREVQLGGAGRDELREAVSAERAAVDSVLAAARGLRPGGRPLSAPMTDRLRTTLHAAAGDDDLRERVRAGRLAEEAQGGGAWPLAAVAEAPAKRGRKATGDGRASKGGGKAPARGAADRETAEREAAEREAQEAAEREERDAQEAAEREAAEAERRELEDRLRRARSEVDAATERLDSAKAEVEAAHERLEGATEAHESARDEVARLEERLG